MLIKQRFSKYLLYAIGEIILVVIGILIALKINTWNQQVNNRKTQFNILNSLKMDLQKDSANLAHKINVDALVAQSNKDLHEDLTSKNIDSAVAIRTWDRTLNYNRLGAINRVMFFFPEKFAYESIKLKGVDIIQNEALRQQIISLYDYVYPRTEDYIQVQMDMLVQSNPLLWKHLETKKGLYFKYPNDANKLLNDVEFINFVSHMSFEYDQAISFYKDNLNKITALLKEIKVEMTSMSR